jgi:undecaprenyl-diphosphatase
MNFLTALSQFVLSFTSVYFLIALIIIGYLNHSKQIMARALFLLLFTMAFNTLLKFYWQIPLPPTVKSDSFAFPSGHMQTSTAFWLWLAFEIRKKWLNYFVGILLIAIGFALIYMGYHSYNDVIFASIFALFEIILYRLMLTKISVEEQPYIGLAFACFNILVIYMIKKPLPHLWLSLGAMLGFSLGYKANLRYVKINYSNLRIIKTVACFLFVAGAYIALDSLNRILTIQQLTFAKFFIISFIISFVIEAICQKIFISSQEHH